MSVKRIVIVGTSCSGKTTLAKAIAGKKNIAHIELDVLFWQPGWRETPQNEFHSKIRHAINATESWVLSGNYNSAKQITLPVATDIIWLNYPLFKNLWRGLKRSTRRILSGTYAFEGCRETFRGTFLSRKSILWWILKTHSRRRAEFTELLISKQFPYSTIWIVKNETDYQELMKSI